MKALGVGLVALLAFLAGAVPARAQGIPSDAEWFAFATPHFDVSFTAGLEPLARRAADRAERAYALLSERFVAPPEGRIQLLVSDNADLSNGFGAPFPRNRIVAYAHPPASALSLAYTDDWVGLLVLHELVHIFHLDYAEGVWPALREVFGRDPYLFPEIFTPGWMVEGLGVYFESEYTGGGRVAGSIVDMELRAAILEDAFFDIDTATLDPVVWPGSTTRYIYGSFFVDYLARTYGPERVGALIEEIGGRIVPYRYDDAARDALGTTLTQAWHDWEDELRTSYSALADSLRALGLTEPEILSTGGWAAHHPRFSPDGDRIAYADNDGRDDAGIAIRHADGSTAHLVDRSSTEAPAWNGDGSLIQSQLDFDGRHRLFSDVYSISTDGDVRRLTRGARVSEPDPHPSGGRAVVVADAGGTNVLALLDLRTGEVTNLTSPDLDVYWSAPRWSPSGDRIVASRWSAGGRYDVVLLDSAGTIIREITADRAIDSNPAWSPDGRYIVFSSDRTGVPNLFAYDLDQNRLWQVTNVLTGAFEPDVSPDGRWIAFALYRADGYYIARIPFAPDRWRVAPSPNPPARPPASASDLARQTGGEVEPYSAWPTILPTH